jgi:hypothetical protein
MKNSTLRTTEYIITAQVVTDSDICNPQVCDLPRCCLLVSPSSLLIISNFRRVLNVVLFLLDDSPTSEFVV